MKNMLLLLTCLMFFSYPVLSQNNNQKTAAATVRSFVKWYGKNWEKLSAFETNTINMGPLELKENQKPPFYSINFKGVDVYINKLYRTGFFSEQYLAAQRKQFKEADKNFKKYPQDDGPPEGFQYDRFFLTQDDFLPDIKNIDKVKITERLLKNNAADVRMYFPLCNMTYRYGLSNKKGKWQIDSITNIISTDN